MAENKTPEKKSIIRNGKEHVITDVKKNIVDTPKKDEGTVQSQGSSKPSNSKKES